ncbi:MAG TPA: patatin-like protein [Gaiellales bacterium]
MSTPRQGARREIRLALVLNGGVSLAVWMGGVTHEIDHLRRARAPIQPAPAESAVVELYGKLLDALGADLRVDVIAGSSAGGINGAALGAAIAVGKPLLVDEKPLRDLWISVGDMAELLRSPGKADPPSLLMGDDYMLPAMTHAFTSILSAGDAPPAELTDAPDGYDPAALRAGLKAERDAARTIRLFVTTTAFTPNQRPFVDAIRTAFDVPDNRLRFRFVRDPWLERDDFADRDAVIPVIARAARASASFPAAFEPTFLDPNAIEAKFLSIDGPTFAMDGGVLDNEPFDPVLDQLSQMPADEHVSRYLVYIVPYSNAVPTGDGVTPPPAPKPEMPTLSTVIGDVLNLPRDAGIDRDMDRIVNLQALATTREETNLTLLDPATTEDLGAIAAGAYPIYSANRRRSAAAEVQTPSNGLGPNGKAETVYRQFAAADPGPDGAVSPVPDAFTVPTLPDWTWGFAAAERLAVNALAVLRKAFAEAAGEARQTMIKDARAVVSVAIGRIRALSAASAGPASPDDNLRLGEAVHAIIARLNAVFPRPEGEWLTRLLQVEVVTQSLPSSLARRIQPFGLVRLSADRPNLLGSALAGRSTPETKLAGMRLQHFGGFLKQSWRQNDWIWGRLDGAATLVTLLLTEHREGGEPWSAPAAAAVAEAVFPTEPDDLARHLVAAFSADAGGAPLLDAAAARARFAELATAESVIPEACANAIIRWAQVTIVWEELPRLAETCGVDEERGWSKKPFKPKAPAGASAMHCLDEFTQWDIKDEPLSDEAGTRALTKLAAQAGVVGSSMLAGTHAGVPGAVRAPLRWLRGAALGAYLFVQSWFHSRGAGLVVALLLSTAAVLTVTVSSALAAVTVPIAIGAIVGGSALLLGGVPKPGRCVVVGVSLAAPIVAAFLLFHHTQGHYPWAAAAWLVIGGSVVAGLVIGTIVELCAPSWRLIVFLAGLLVAAAELACLRSTGSLPSWIANLANDHWPIGLLCLAIVLPLVFGMRALSNAVSPSG